MSDSDIELYLREIGQFRLLTEEEERSLARRVLKGDMQAREEMIRSNLRLVVSVAKRYGSRGLPLLDVVAEGNLGLLKAVERYNPESGRRFSTYASWWIKQTIRRAISSKVKNVRVPTYMSEMVSRWKKVSSQLLQELHRQATPEEIAAEMDVDPEKAGIIQKAIGASYSSSFTGLGRGDGEEEDLEEVLARAGKESRPDNSWSKNEEEKLELLIGCLDQRAETVVRSRYGIGQDNEPLTLDAIGATFVPPITRERVRQIETQGLKTMLRILEEEEM